VRIDDGNPQKPLRVNVSQTGVWLSAGSHRVSFEYPGRTERISLLIGLIGLFSLAACMLRKKPLV
jgi:TctA family transporter